MKTIKILSVSLLIFALSGCAGEQTNQSNQEQNNQTEQAGESNPENKNQEQNLSECKKAGGTIIPYKECDGSMSEWCIIKGKGKCYADQVKNGECPKGEFTPRVVCETEEEIPEEEANQEQ